LSPEVHNSPPRVDYNKQPSWELGVLCYEIICGVHPYGNYPDGYPPVPHLRVFESEVNFKRMKEKNIPENFISVVKNLLSNNPKDRLPIKDAFVSLDEEHKIISNNVIAVVECQKSEIQVSVPEWSQQSQHTRSSIPSSFSLNSSSSRSMSEWTTKHTRSSIPSSFSLNSSSRNTMSEWTTERVCQWMKELKGLFKDYSLLIKKFEIDGKHLLEIIANELWDDYEFDIDGDNMIIKKEAMRIKVPWEGESNFYFLNEIHDNFFFVNNHFEGK